MTSTTETQGTSGPAAAGRLEARNWGEDLVSRPQAIVEARSVDDVVAVMRDASATRRRCGRAARATPRPRALPPTEARSSACARMSRIVDIGEDTVTRGGRRALDRRREGARATQPAVLRQHRAGQCDARLGGVLGDEGCVDARRVRSGELVLRRHEDGHGERRRGRDLRGGDPELLQAARSSYGLLGVVVEATFRVRPLQAMSVEHRVYSSRVRRRAARARRRRSLEHAVHLPVPRQGGRRDPPVHGGRGPRGRRALARWRLPQHNVESFAPGSATWSSGSSGPSGSATSSSIASTGASG